jgi:hypothetical protein
VSSIFPLENGGFALVFGELDKKFHTPNFPSEQSETINFDIFLLKRTDRGLSTYITRITKFQFRTALEASWWDGYATTFGMQLRILSELIEKTDMNAVRDVSSILEDIAERENTDVGNILKKSYAKISDNSSQKKKKARSVRFQSTLLHDNLAPIDSDNEDESEEKKLEEEKAPIKPKKIVVKFKGPVMVENFIHPKDSDNKYMTASTKALSQLWEAAVDPSWKYHYEIRGISVHQRDTGDAKKFCMMGKGTIEADAMTVFALVSDDSLRSEWDVLTSSVEHVLTIGEITSVEHRQFRGVWVFFFFLVNIANGFSSQLQQERQ